MYFQHIEYRYRTLCTLVLLVYNGVSSRLNG